MNPIAFALTSRRSRLFALLPLIVVIGMLLATSLAFLICHASGQVTALDPGAPSIVTVAPATANPALPGWLGLIPILVPIAIAGLKVWIPRIPPHLLPVIAPVLGAGLEVLLNYASGAHGPGSGIAGAILGSAGVGLREIVDQAKQRVSASADRILSICLLVGLLGLMSGCAQFSTVQTDRTYTKDGDPEREVTTRANAMTFFASKTALAKWQASQTDKQQRASVGSLDQTADATGVTSNLVSAVISAAINAAAKAK